MAFDPDAFDAAAFDTLAVVPSPWLSADVGAVGLAGHASYADGMFTIDGAGADIWLTADGFHFVYQTLSGNGTLVAHVNTVENTHTFAKAGIMLRNTLDAGSAHVVLDARPAGEIELLQRAVTDGETVSLGAVSTNVAPVWLRLIRSGTTIAAAISENGSAWTTVGTATMGAGAIVVGMIVCSHDTAALNTSTFDDVSALAVTLTVPIAVHHYSQMRDS